MWVSVVTRSMQQTQAPDSGAQLPALCRQQLWQHRHSRCDRDILQRMIVSWSMWPKLNIYLSDIGGSSSWSPRSWWTWPRPSRSSSIWSASGCRGHKPSSSGVMRSGSFLIFYAAPHLSHIIHNNIRCLTIMLYASLVLGHLESINTLSEKHWKVFST